MVTVESAGFSHIGQKRETNEDRILIEGTTGLFLVADGMGGHQAGEIASSLVVESIREFIAQPAATRPVATPSNPGLSAEAALLRESIHWSNQVVHRKASSSAALRGMGSTVAAIYFSRDTLIAANVGDSPIYLVRNGKIDLLSVPHTLEADLPPGPMSLLSRHVLTRAIGPRVEVQADLCELNCYKEDILVICSDGLSTKVAPAEILSIVTSRPTRNACRTLVDLANQRGGDDNISAVVLRVTRVNSANGTAVGRWAGLLRRLWSAQGAKTEQSG
jgi:protein phosphatase